MPLKVRHLMKPLPNGRHLLPMKAPHMIQWSKSMQPKLSRKLLGEQTRECVSLYTATVPNPEDADKRNEKTQFNVLSNIWDLKPASQSRCNN